MGKVQIFARTEEKTLDQLKELAKNDRRSLSNYIDMVLRLHCEEKLKK